MRHPKDGSTFSDAMRNKDDLTIDPIYMSGGLPNGLTKSMLHGRSLEPKRIKKIGGNIFNARFQPSDVPSLKQRLSKEAYEIRARKFQADEYKPPHQHTFRDYHTPLGKATFMANTKIDGMKYQSNVYDKKDIKSEAEMNPNLKEDLKKQGGFVRFWNIANHNHNIDKSIYKFLDKDIYGEEEPYDTHYTLFSKKPPFKLYFKSNHKDS